MTVLIVDDDDNILTALKLLLKSEGIGCVASRGERQATQPMPSLFKRSLRAVRMLSSSSTIRTVIALAYEKKPPAALFRNSSCVSAGKRRDFCRLRRGR